MSPYHVFLLTVSIFILSLYLYNKYFIHLIKKPKDDRKIVLLQGKEVMNENLERTNVTRKQIIHVLRKAHVRSLSQVKSIYYLSNGDIEVDFVD